MLLADSIVEEHISIAIRRGEFDDLPGSGKPLLLDDDLGIPEELRVPYRILRNAGCLPAELTLRKEIHELENLLDHADTGSEQQSIRRRLILLKSRLAAHGHGLNLLVEEGVYRAKLVSRMTREKQGSSRQHRARD